MKYLSLDGFSYFFSKIKSLFITDASFDTSTLTITHGDGTTKQIEFDGVLRYRGNVIYEEDLPTDGNKKGDVWNVMITEMNYMWNGMQWDPLGQNIADDPITESTIDELFTLL